MGLRLFAYRMSGPIVLKRRGARMDRHCATRRSRRLAEVSVVRPPRMHPHMRKDDTYVRRAQSHKD